VIVDVYDRTFNMNVEQLEDAISSRTRCIMPVHLFGQCANMKAIREVADKHGLYVIEDNAQSIGARYIWDDGKEAMSGTMGHLGCLSFYPSKNLGAYGDAGAVIGNDPELAERVRSIANHGMAKERYYHERVGVNSRLDSFQAAVLAAKLSRLDEYIDARQAAAAFYDRVLGEMDEVLIPARAKCGTHVFHQYTIQVAPEKRDELKQYLGELGIPSMIYYPVPTQEQDAFKGILRTPVSLETTNALCGKVLSLPMHSELDQDQLEYICGGIKAFYSK
jgi:dTDP-4-amino-4,6-dideoxygalactose transaminase